MWLAEIPIEDVGFKELGLLGIVIAGFMFLLKWVLNHTDKLSETHATERREWKEEFVKRDDILIGLVKETNSNIATNTACLGDLSGSVKELRHAMENGAVGKEE